MSHLPYDTFRETLAIRYPHCGHALWDPSPEGLYDAVAVGDVGFIREGYFHRLFNVLLPEDHPSHINSGVPEYHQPLQPGLSNHIRKGTDGTDDFCSRHVSLSRGRNIQALGPDDESQVTVSCPGRRGALSSLPFPAQREDTVARGDFGKWMIKHIDQWFAFASNLGLGVNRMQDIILVTGRHCTKSWVNVAFSDSQRDAEVSFGAQVSGSSGVNIERRVVRGDAVLKLGPSGENLPENQCIFVRGFRVVRLLNIWPRLKGRAGPSTDADEHESTHDRQLESIGTSANSKYEDPLHVLLQYISEKAPGCDMALVHDDDLAYINGASLDSLQPDTLLEHLRGISPEVSQVQCEGILPSSASSGVGAGTTNVATLSKDACTIGLIVNDILMQGRVLHPDHGKRCSESVDGLAPIPLTSSEDPPAIELPTIEGTSPHLENQTKSASTSSLKSAPLGHSRLLGDGDENTKVEHHPPNFTVPIAPLSAPLQPPTVSAGPKDLSPSPPPVPPHNNSRKKRPGTRPLSSHGSLSADEWDVDWDGWGTDGWNTDARHTGGWGHNAPRASGWDDAALGTVGWGDDSDAWSIEEWGTGGWEARRMARSPRRSRNTSSKFAGVSVDLPPSGTRSGRNSVIHPKASSPRPSTLRKSYTLPVEASDVVAPRLSLSTSLPVPIHQGPQWEPLIPEVLAAMEKVASDTETLLQVAEDGTVSAGNLEGLISRIIDGTTDPSKDNRFRATFLTTYQLFSTSTRLFEILKKRFESAGLNPANARSQYSILLFIESWIKKGFEDEDLTCSSKIRGFALSISGPEDLNAKAAEIASMIFNPDYVYLRQPRGIAWLANKPVARPPGMRASDVASALTVLTGSRFQRIIYWEYVNFTRRQSNTRGIESFNAIHKLVTMWVQRSIKEPAYLEDQAKIFEEWIHTARECRAMKNFSSAHAIITALMSRKIAMLVLACESQATEVLDTLNRDLMPTDAYHETLRQVETKELIPLLDPHLSTLNSIFARSNPTVEANGHHLINFELCRELAEQIDSVTQYSPPGIHSETRQDVLEYVEYNLQSSATDSASGTPVVRNVKLGEEWPVLKQQEATQSSEKSKAPPKGRLDVVRRPEGHIARWRGDMAQWREDMTRRREQDVARRHEQDLASKRQEDMARRREEDMERWHDDMARWREDRTRWGEDRARRRDRDMKSRREEDMAQWREDMVRWLDDMARWREDRTRRKDVAQWREEAMAQLRTGDMVPRSEDVAQRRGEDKEPQREDTAPRRKGFVSRLFGLVKKA